MMEETVMYSGRDRLKATHTRTAIPHGFTLIELMVTIAVLAILLGIAVPSFNDVALGSKLGSYANNLVASTNVARSEAIKRNTTVVLCVSANGTSCAATGGWEQGWIAACKTTDNIACDGSGSNWLVFQRQPAASSGFKITANPALTTLDFTASGVDTTPATLTICRATPTVGTQQRQVQISATGRASVAKTTSSTCS
jgi:type IV fimbrial biogenesis protein FimT